MDEYGFLKYSLVDYPGEVAGVIFFPGCNFKCPYCHNQNLIIGKVDDPWSYEEILLYLSKAQKKLITGVCITGGEPTLNENKLLSMIDQLKKLGLKVKLDTNGSNPQLLKKIDVNFVAMDLKTSLNKYKLLSTDSSISKKILQSIKIIKKKWSNHNHEFRTTMYPALTMQADINNIEKLLGKSNWKKQEYKNPKQLL